MAPPATSAPGRPRPKRSKSKWTQPVPLALAVVAVVAVGVVFTSSQKASKSGGITGEKPSVITGTPGVRKEVLQEGDGKTFPRRGQRVKVHYTGTLETGKKFDSSRDRGDPFTFTIGVGQVIKGWDQGVSQMSLGERAKLTILPEYGYGARGAGGVIPGGATLIFDVELLAIE